MADKNNEYQFDSVNLIIYLWKRKLPIILITSVAAIMSIIVSLLIEEKYKSEVIIFPAAAGSVSQDLLSTSYNEKSILKLGEDEEVEQLLQVLHSDDLRERIIDKFSLFEHYEIEPDQKYKITELYKTYSENINFEPTKFMSVKISVLDKDPQMAADIANEICDLVDTIMISMQLEKAMEALNLVEEKYFSLRDEIANLEDSLDIIRQFGIVDYRSQAEMYSEAYGLALIEGNMKAVNELQKKLDILAKYGGAYLSIYNYLEVERKQLSILKAKYAEAQIDANQTLSRKFVVNRAMKAEKKSYPVRWLIVVLSTFSAFILSIILILLVDTINKYAKELK